VSQDTWPAPVVLAEPHLFDDNRWPGYVTPGDLAGMLQAKAHLTVLGS